MLMTHNRCFLHKVSYWWPWCIRRKPTTVVLSKCRLPSSSASVVIWVRSENRLSSAARRKASSFLPVVILEQVLL